MNKEESTQKRFGFEIRNVQNGVLLIMEVHLTMSRQTAVPSRLELGQTSTRGTFCRTGTCRSLRGGCGCPPRPTETRGRGKPSGQLPRTRPPFFQPPLSLYTQEYRSYLPTVALKLQVCSGFHLNSPVYTLPTRSGVSLSSCSTVDYMV